MITFKKMLLIFVLLIGFFVMAAPSYAYVSVKGHYRSNGTYVKPHVRSNPNGLKYDNYGYKSGPQYNSSYYNPNNNYSSDWYTPSYQTDLYYYQGDTIYASYNTSVY